MLSIKKSKTGVGWTRIPVFKYQSSKVNRDQYNIQDEEVAYGRRIYYMLSFEYFFENDDDEVYFAYSLPYTFSMV